MKHLYTVTLLLAALLLAGSARAQYGQQSLGATPLGMVLANEFSKEQSIYRAKEFVMNEALGPTDAPQQFEIYPLAAAVSGELTTLVYKADAKQRDGLVLAFWGTQWNAAGVVYKAYGFKNLPKAKAVELLTKLEKVIDEKRPYMSNDPDNNNVYFKYDDLTFLIYYTSEPRLRVFWGQFDSEWNISALRKTKRRFERKM